MQKFFQFLDQRFRTLQYLSQRVTEGAPPGWEGVCAGLQDEVAQLRRRGLEKVTTMEEILQVGSKRIKVSTQREVAPLAQLWKLPLTLY